MRAAAIAVSMLLLRPAPAQDTPAPDRKMSDRLRAALDWLTRHQNDNGSWSVQDYVRHCSGEKCEPNPGHEDFLAGVTGLAALAMISSGLRLQDTDAFGKSLRRAVDRITTMQGSDGAIFPDAQKMMYGHAIATYALAEALRPLPADAEEGLRKSLAKAVEFLLAARNPDAVWRYSARCNENDSSVTAWALQALFAARRAGQSVPDQPIKDALAWLDSVTHSSERVGYNAKGTGKVFVPGVNENFNHRETLTAAAGLCRSLAERKPRPAALKLVMDDLPKPFDLDNDAYYWYYGARFVRAVADAKSWELWRDAVLKILLDRQRWKAGACDRGSWPPSDRWSGEGGRVYVTAISAIVLAMAQEPVPKWIFHLKDGATTIKVVSYQEKSGNYILQLTDGNTQTVKKTDVHRIQKVK